MHVQCAGPKDPTSKYIGVSQVGVKWFATINIELGKYDTELEAARAYDRGVVWCQGLTATTNFPVEEWALSVRQPPHTHHFICVTV